MPRRSRGSDSKPPPTNPTSAKATAYTYTCIALILLYKYLDDEPRHIRYREKQGMQPALEREGRVRNVSHGDSKRTRPLSSPSPLFSPRGNVLRRSGRVEPYDLRPATPPRPSQRLELHRGIPARPRVYVPDNGTIQPSRAESREAWTRMRSVTPLKRVRWGTVHIHEQEQTHVDGEDEQENEHEQQHEPIRTQRDIPPPKREIWGPVTDDDIWLSCIDFDIWRGCSGPEIWGPADTE